MRKASVAVALIAIFLFVGGYILYSQSLASKQVQTQGAQTIQLKDKTIRISVVSTPSARQQGLSGRAGLEADEGMLFVFPEDGIYAFWMKDMRFSIDILWLAADGTIVYMAQSVSPDTYPENFEPNIPARYVLELPAGYAKEHNVAIGDIVRLSR